MSRSVLHKKRPDSFNGGHPCSVGLPIRPGAGFDLEDIYALNVNAFPEAWSRRSLADAMDTGFDFQVFRNRNDRLVAYYLGQDIADEVHILQMVVAEPFRGRGTGRQFIRGILAEKSLSGMSKAFLEVRAGNKIARRLYSGLGFSVTGRRKGYYLARTDGQREDALLMIRKLDTF